MTSTPTTSRTHIRWWICLIIFFATTIIYSDRQFLSLLKSTLAVEIHWTDSEFATVNSCFLGAYAFGLLFLGRIIDRVGVKKGYAIVVLLWSLAAFSHTFVTTVGGFMAARIFLGLSEAGNFPAAIKGIAQWFPSTERAFATTLFNSGANVGAILAPFLVAWLLRQGYSWHAPFFLAGCAGLIWVGIWWACYGNPETSKAVSPAELAWIRSDPVSPEESAPAVSWFSLFRHPQTWSYIVAKFLTDPVWYFILFWLPDYFKKTRDLDIKASWPHLMTVYAVITVLSLFGGYFPGMLARRGWSLTAARKTAMFCYAALVVPILFVGSASDWTAVLLIGLVGAAHQSWSANLFTTVSDMFPRNSVGSVVGIGSTAGAIGGMLFQWFCGHILDIYGAAHAQDGYFLLFCFAAFAYLIAFGLQHLLAPKFAPISLAGDRLPSFHAIPVEQSNAWEIRPIPFHLGGFLIPFFFLLHFNKKKYAWLYFAARLIAHATHNDLLMICVDLPVMFVVGMMGNSIIRDSGMIRSQADYKNSYIKWVVAGIVLNLVIFAVVYFAYNGQLQ